MNELGQIRTAVLTALKDAGIEALERSRRKKSRRTPRCGDGRRRRGQWEVGGLLAITWAK